MAIIIKKLKDEHFARLKQIFREDFSSDAPLPETSEIFGAFEDGKLVGFVLAERVVMIGQVWVHPHHRNDSTGIIMPLVRTVRDEYEGKENVGTVASESRFEQLFNSMGMQKIDGIFYRKNI